MSEDTSLVKEGLELALGATLVAIVLPFVAAQLAMEKVKNFRKFMAQVKESDL
jgi:hypothetical protein